MRTQGMSNTNFRTTGIGEPKVPGTVDMKVTDDSKTAYGLSLTPTPSDDPNDPLNWTQGKKNSILFLVAAYSFLANGALIGPSVYVGLLAQRFNKTTSETSQLVNNPNLLFGFGSLIFVPMYHKLDRRPTMLISIIIYCIGLLGCALSQSYDVLMGFRMVHGFGSSVCEALPAQAVADVFFLHERGKALGWYTYPILYLPDHTPVFWVCSTYGMFIGLAGLAFTATFPIIVAAPPYSWPIENTGLVAISAFIGYLLAAAPFSTVPDRVSAWLTRKNNNIHEAEYRLWCLAVVFFVSPAALILYGYCAGNHLHWFGLVFAVGMFQFGAFFYFTYTLAYAMDSYEARIPEMLIAMNIGKQSISFAFGYKVIDWVQAYGYIKVFAGIFCGALTINNLFVFVFLIFGKWSRRWLSTTALSKMHRESLD
ncbi:hypothetical protein FCULG_00005540 [Fusarium culmorum]|uniref:Major facilitator superfamily (MFS) profile domain-containing protein n=1 Tax=Fusarium culmorum TaxID=5516 RepID=A0A2T4GVT9_FUSCU|nr:hypothetical protein FCULG_00005540 [Fusarium culmorum]